MIAHVSYQTRINLVILDIYCLEVLSNQSDLYKYTELFKYTYVYIYTNTHKI